jgi:alanyl aminopeptidase
VPYSGGRHRDWLALCLIGGAACAVTQSEPSTTPAGAPAQQSVASAAVPDASSPPPLAPSLPLPPRPSAPAIGPRIPRAFVPTGYHADLVIGDRLGGHIEIAGHVPAAASLIWLYGVDIDVSSAVATNGATRVVLAAGRVPWNGTQLLSLQARYALAPGDWTIAIDYRAEIAEQDVAHDSAHDVARGAFRETVGGAQYVFTQGEPMDMRRIFPCVDEPDVKVPWRLALDVPAADVVAGNAPIARETALPGDRKRVELAPTAPIASYVVAFAVGPFDVTDVGHATSGVPVRVLVPHGYAGGEHAAADGQTAVRVLDALEVWTGVPYAYGKLDLVAVPRTGEEWAAMENPGLVTFAARFLDPAYDTSGFSWLGVAAHELAHQWFGDLVTPQGWEDVWLNEGFAMWLGAKITAQLDPAAGAARIIGEREEALEGKPAAVAPVQPPTDERELEPYMRGSRGGEVLRMFEAYLGADVFQRAVRAYLVAHAGGTAKTSDLAAALDAASGSKLDDALDDAVHDANVPQIGFVRTCTRGRGAVSLTTSAPRTMPICVVYDRDGARGRACWLVAAAGLDLPLPAKACPRWLMPNADGAGVYRTQYTADAATALVTRAWPVLAPTERAAMLGDLAAGDHATAIAVLPSVAPLPDDAARAFVTGVLFHTARLVPDDLRAAFDAWVEARYGAMARTVRFTEPPASDEAYEVLDLLAGAHDPVLQRAAVAAAANLDDIAAPYLSIVIVLAAHADATFARSVVASLPAMRDEERRDYMVVALTRVPGIVDEFVRAPDVYDHLSRYERAWLFATTCDTAHRDAIVALASRSSAGANHLADDTVVDCIAERAKLAPIFRAWLAPKKHS